MVGAGPLLGWFALAFHPEALAQEYGNYLDISFTGDGETPSNLERLGKNIQRSASSLQGAASATPSGDATFSIPIGVPATKLTPAIAMTYNSSGGIGTVGRGWTVSVGPTIRQVTGLPLRSYEAEEVYLAAGGGFDGRIQSLFDVDPVFGASRGWNWVSSSPGWIEASFDPSASDWTLEANGMTTLLGPEASDNSWHVVSQEDRSGNRIDWTWTGDRPLLVQWGGDDASPPFLELAFVYGAAEHNVWQAQSGYLHLVEHRLIAIELRSSYEAASPVLRHVWSLEYDSSDEHLIAVDETVLDETGSDPQTRVVATFEYTTYDAEAFVERDDLPQELSVTIASMSDDPIDDPLTVSYQEWALRDVTGDGLADVWNKNSTMVGAQRMEQLDPEDEPELLLRTWDQPLEPVMEIYAEETVTAVLAGDPTPGEVGADLHGTYATRTMLDVDGDGLDDLVTTDALPEDWEAGLNSDAGEDNAAIQFDFTWSVTYVDADGTTTTYDELAPFLFPRISTRASSDELPPEEWELLVYWEDATVDLMDVDGDGWLDVVHFEDGALHWRRKLPGRGQGWSDDVNVALDGAAVFSTQWSVGYVEDVDAAEGQAYSYADNLWQAIFPVIEYSEALTGFYDLNGDGAVDFVDARDGSTWKVWLGTGAGFETGHVDWQAPVPWVLRSDEGRTEVFVCALTQAAFDVELAPQDQLAHVQDNPGVEWDPIDREGVCSGTSGRPSALIGGLLDMDGDGLPDLIHGEELLWYRNLGDEFAAVGTTLPGWFPIGEVGFYGVDSGQLSQSWTVQDINTDPDVAGTAADAQISARGATITTQLLHVGDVDRDGLPDVLDYRDPLGAVALYSGQDCGADPDCEDDVAPWGERTGLLAAVETGAGVRYEFGYQTSAIVWPSGGDLGSDQSTRGSKPLLNELAVTDLVTPEHRGWKRWTYESGHQEYGKWWGFATVAQEELSYERDLGLAFSLPSMASLGRVTTDYVLSPDTTVPSRQIITADFAAPWVPERELAESTVLPVWITEWTYAHFQTPGRGFLNVGGPFPVLIRAIEFEQERSEVPGVSSLPREWTVEVEYDEDWNVTLQRHDAPEDTSQTIEVRTTWLAGDDNLFVPLTVETWARDPFVLTEPPSLVEVEHGDFAYDGGFVGDAPTTGLLTLQEACAGRAGSGLCNETLTWEFGWTPRGSLSAVYAPAGRDRFVDDYAFGEAVAVAERNALGHTVTRDVDNLGRATSVFDANGVETRTTLDDYGREILVEVKGAGAVGYFKKTATTWHDEDVPRWSQTEMFNTLSNGAPGQSVFSYTIFDGFGNAAQTWSPSDDGQWIVSEVERDVRGSLRRTSEPHVESVFEPHYGIATQGPVTASWAYFDIQGRPIATWDIATGRTDHDSPRPGTRREAREDDYVHEEVYDTHQRLLEVWDGQVDLLGDSLTIVGSYAHDGLGRVVEFTDGAGNQWRYDYDGVGRLLEVERKPHSGSLLFGFEPYFAFTWDGPDPATMIEGDLATGTAVVEWSYDGLGRPLTKIVWDPVTATDQLFTWEWDQRAGGTVWNGSKHRVTDPNGDILYTYQPDPVFGQQGLPSRVERRWVGGVTAAFDLDYDQHGHETSRTWPSGKVVTTLHHPNGTIASQSFAQTSVDYTYDQFGLQSGWTLSSGVAAEWDHAIVRFNSRQVPNATWDAVHTGISHWVDYSYHPNGWLWVKEIDALEPIIYEYDELGRISDLCVGPCPTYLERYEYDAGHNPVTLEIMGVGTWTYDPVTRFNEILHRDRTVGASTVNEDFTYDPTAGRMLTWETDSPNAAQDITRTFLYDGAGRLRRIARQQAMGNRTTELDYDVDDNIVFEREMAGVTHKVWRFDGWKNDTKTGLVTESLLPMLRVEGASQRVVYLEPDGHALFTDGPGAGVANDSFEALGAYGLSLQGGFTSGIPWNLDHLHGKNLDRDDQVVHLGARHLAVRDGLWLQPEPLLHLGLTNGDLTRPIAFSGLYAAGNSNAHADPEGYAAETVWDVANVFAGAVSTVSNLMEGNYGWAAVDAFGTVVDVLATGAPFVPGGATSLIKATRFADTAVDVLQTGSKADDLGAVATGVSKTGDFHLPGDVPNDFSVVKGGINPPPEAGTTFSGSFGATKADAAAGVPHNQIQPSTAGAVRAGGGTVEVFPEATRAGNMNYQHANVTEGSSPTTFGAPEPNPVPKEGRIK